MNATTLFTSAVFRSCIIAVVVFTLCPDALSQDRAFQLTFLERIHIHDADRDLNEPSGLAVSSPDNKLWAISDDAAWLFNLGPDGHFNANNSFNGLVKGLEGVTSGPQPGSLFAVMERDEETADAVVQISVDRRGIAATLFLSDMENYAAIARDFESGGKNKGLEGITWNPDTNTFFLVKEGDPRMMIEVAADLGSIGRHRILSGNAGFTSDEADDTKLDVSGLDYDTVRKAFWIVSDKGKRLFLYDFEVDKVIQSAALSYNRNGKFKLIDKAEGVAVNSGLGRMFVVSDSEARLYVYDLR